MQRDFGALGTGAMGGVIGTAMMSAVTMAVRRMGKMGRQPPEVITASALAAGDVHPRDEWTQDMLAVIFHFAFGTGIGALFALLYRRAPLRHWGNAVLAGIVYATLVWATSYLGWIPALGILPPAPRDEPGRARTMFIAHWVYGAALGAVVGKQARRADDRGSADA